LLWRAVAVIVVAVVADRRRAPGVATPSNFAGLGQREDLVIFLPNSRERRLWGGGGGRSPAGCSRRQISTGLSGHEQAGQGRMRADCGGGGAPRGCGEVPGGAAFDDEPLVERNVIFSA
jgi:hypothetical protein